MHRSPASARIAATRRVRLPAPADRRSASSCGVQQRTEALSACRSYSACRSSERPFSPDCYYSVIADAPRSRSHSVRLRWPSEHTYTPAWWVPGAHLQTLWGKLARRPPIVPPRRERWPTPDDDEIEIRRLDQAIHTPG